MARLDGQTKGRAGRGCSLESEGRCGRERLWLHVGGHALHCPDKHEPSTLLNTEPRRRVVMLEEEINRVHEVERQSLHHWVRGR
jgi:hypothetical protein